jgi:acetyl-CoA synthetase
MSFPLRTAAADAAPLNYSALYRESVEHPEAFWAEQTKRLEWMKAPTKIKDTAFTGDIHIKWFEDGVLNASANCIDRHLSEHSEKVAILWEGDEPGMQKQITYMELHEKVCRFANVLKKLGAKKGDRVVIYMPMIPEAVYAMLACARIGAVHSVVFGGFSPEALHGRIEDCGAEIVITADEGRRGGKRVPLKKNVDKALALMAKKPQHVLVIRNTKNPEVPFDPVQDYWYDDAQSGLLSDCDPEPMNAEDPLFVLYTSGSTGKPKGVLHTTGGYLLYAAMTHDVVFDLKQDDIFWCTADVGWVTGHSYIVYGPLANASTLVLFEGTPTYPTPERFWQVVDKYQVSIFYTAPTAIRALMSEGMRHLDSTERTSLRVLGTVGEPINVEAWNWYHEHIGLGQCPIVDTWWQTETGGHMLTPIANVTKLKPGSATLPFFGVQPVILDEKGNELHGACEGNLCFKDSWPGQMRSVFGNHARFKETYFSQFPGYYFSGDGARRDEDGYYWITGRVDDVLNVSGHRIGTAEIENALDLHPKVAESAVVGYPHPVKGEGIYAYVVLFKDASAHNDLVEELLQCVREKIGAFAVPDFVHLTTDLPKTRSGKIMRRILRKVAADDCENLGDTNTLTNPEVVEMIIRNRLNC